MDNDFKEFLGNLFLVICFAFLACTLGFFMGVDITNKSWKNETAKIGCSEYTVDSLTGKVEWDWKYERKE